MKRHDIQARIDAVTVRNARLAELDEEREAQHRAIREEMDTDTTLMVQIRQRAEADLALQLQIKQRAEIRGERLARLDAAHQADRVEAEAIRRELDDIKRAIDGLPPVEVAQA